jgi:hypothetical protein
MVDRRHDNEVWSKVRGKVNRIRHRVTMNVYGSARRRLWPQVNPGNAEPVRHLDFGNRSRRLLDFGNRSRRLLVAEPRVRRAAKEKKRRALMVSRLRHNSTRSRRSSSSSSSGSKVARLPQPITARATGSRKVETRNNQKKRHRHGRNNFGAVTPAAPEREVPELRRCSGDCLKRLALPLVGRLCQTPGLAAPGA